jgi:hypothetical protein
MRNCNVRTAEALPALGNTELTFMTAFKELDGPWALGTSASAELGRSLPGNYLATD